MKSETAPIRTAPFIKTEEQYQGFKFDLEACSFFEPGLLAAVGVG
jgi:hypothetical protein